MQPHNGHNGGHNPGNNFHGSGLSYKQSRHTQPCLSLVHLEVHYSDKSNVKKASVMYDPCSHESRGVSFVIMETVEEANASINLLTATEIMCKIVTVEMVCFSALLSMLTVVATLSSTWACLDTHVWMHYGMLKRHHCMFEFIRCRGMI
ncbi:hypothetical protein HD554DRAFT_2020430 [Boletus coccyginus]|nr:hypothetical protein HD554DRAFT_2020430 [Boletus coccyginus]